MRRAVPLAFAVLLAGCYQYSPMTTTSAPAGVRAQVLLTDQGTVEMARWVGPSAEIIEGEVIRQDGSELTLAVRRLQRRSGVEEFWKGESVSIARASVAQVTERRLSAPRTTLASVGLAAVLYVFAQGFAGYDGLLGRGQRGPAGSR